MSNHLQDEAIERLGIKYGRVRVDDNFADRVVRAVAPSGKEYKIPENGVERPTGFNHSIDWSYGT